MNVAEAASKTVGAPKRAAKRHPNAATAGISGSVATLVIAGAGALGFSMEAATAAALATLTSTGALVVGRSGVRGVMAGVWSGFDDREDS